MSNYFQGVTFASQSVAPIDDAQLNRAMLPDGILSGCTFYTNGSTLTMSAGSLLLCGRQVRHAAEQSWNISGATSGYARLVLTVDLSRTSTETEFDQVNESIEYAATMMDFPDLETADINAAGVRYQAAVCTVLLGSGGITGFIQNLPDLSTSGVFAPAGYGPGQKEAAMVQSIAGMDSLTTTGVFGLLLPLSDSYIGGVDIRMSAVVVVVAYDADTTLQTVSVIGTPTKLQRWRTGGSWGPWCVQNPPMALGTEYRTTEQWNGAAVFTKRLAFAASGFSSQNVSFAHGVENLDVCISADVLWKRTDSAGGWRHLPASEYSTGSLDGQIEDVTGDSIRFRLGSELQYRMKQSTEPVYVTLRYTKK